MTRTVYRNASGLPDSDQVTTARDQSTLGRAIQDRFPRYYRYFSISAFNYHGRSIRNHNKLLGNVEGVDGIKTGYTRASGFNLVTSMRRGNRHLVGVVMGGRSGGSRDAIMRNLLAENLEKAASKRTVAAITERSPSEANADVAEDQAQSRPTQMVQVQGAMQVASAAPEEAAPMRPAPPVTKPSIIANATAALPPAQAETGARSAHQRRDPDPGDLRDSRFVRADEAGSGQDGPGQGRADEAGVSRSRAAGAAGHQCDPAGALRGAGDIGFGGSQGRIE